MDISSHRTPISKEDRDALRSALTRPTGTLTPTLRERARFPAAPPLAAETTAPANQAQPVALQSVAASRRNGPLTLRGRADRFYRPLVAPKWCRWGYWESDGSALYVTRIL